ncbi:unnamed protein product [Symbiodinium sp. KB8]|nr:unnamed protein product [Symbiodinium sp. KB8]
MLRWITRFHLSVPRMQEAWNDTYLPSTDPNNAEVRAFIAGLPAEEQYLKAEEAMDRADDRLRDQHAWTIPSTASLVANIFVSLSDLTQDQRQVFTSLMAHRFDQLLMRVFSLLRTHEWWQRVLLEAKTEYDEWRKGERFVRMEARGVAMLTKVDEGVALELIDQYELYVGRQEKAQRNVDDVLILRFLLLIAFAVDSNRMTCSQPVTTLVIDPCKPGVGAWQHAASSVCSDEEFGGGWTNASEGGAIKDAEWFADGGVVEADAEEELSARDASEARTAWNEWDRLVKSSREDWQKPQKLPKVEIVDFVYVEAIERKTHGEVLTAIGRMHARAKAEGFDVRKRLKIETQQSLPFNTKVQVISRSWKRETWAARTTTALVKCPSADMFRGWVVATEDGKLLTTGKLFPSVDQEKVSFSSTGPAVDLDAPDHRVTGKRAVRQLQTPMIGEPVHGADKLAKKLYEGDLFRTPETGRDEQLRTCNFLTGAFTYGGMTGCSQGETSGGCSQVPHVSLQQEADISSVLNEVAVQHQKVCALLQTAEEECGEQANASVDKLYWNALDALERQGACQSLIRESLVMAKTQEARKAWVAEEVTLPDSSDPPPLQTKIIAADQVRREPEKWVPSMTEEYQSLVSRTDAVEELSDSQYRHLLEDPEVTLEIIPGKLVYVHKPSGRRKSRIVGCGNYCQGGSSERNELYASGAGAESLRLMIRRCALQQKWVLASVDVRTAFLQAPLLEQQRDGRRLIAVVRVPSISRETGVTACKFWKVRKALYGLASAPKSWSNYRDKILAGLRIPCEGGVLQLSKMLEDANLLHVIRFSGDGESIDSAEGERVGLVALYVDDVLIGAERPICEAVIKALQEQWELSSPEWIAETGDQMKFAGYELQKLLKAFVCIKRATSKTYLSRTRRLLLGLNELQM